MIFFLFSLLSVAAIGGAAVVGGGGGGGGGGGNGSNSGSTSFTRYTYTADPTWIVTPDASQIASFKTTEYNNTRGIDGAINPLNMIKAAEAYSLLQTNGKAIAGDNIKIGISDTGVSSTHREIFNNYDAANSTTPTDIEGHGTHVASIAAGVKGITGMQGVAFNAKIISVNILGTNKDNTGGEAGIAYAASKGAKVVNMSWIYASAGKVKGVTLPIYTNKGDANYLAAKTILSSEFASAVTNDVVMVAAVGNDGANNKTQMAMPAIFAVDSVTNEQMIAVAAVDKNKNIAAYSNRCKQARDFCLVAPGGSGEGITGDNIYAAAITDSLTNLPSDNSYIENAGTSMAAPYVSGAAAVLRAAWPYLSAAQTVRILLDTATDLGTIGVDDVYGRGMLNLESAVSAQGPNNIAGAITTSSAGVNASTSSISTNAIFGNAYSQNLAPILKNAVFFDKYGRDYPANLDQKISTIASSYSLENMLFTNNSSASMPINFGENYSNNLAVKFDARNIFTDPISGETKHNQFGLKHLTVDRSREDQSGFNASDVAFSYSKNFGNDIKLGFSKNDFNEELSSNSPAKNYNLISFNNFSANPYKSLNAIVSLNGGNKSRISNNQLNISQKLTPNLTTNLSFSNYNYSNAINRFSSDESRVFDSGLAYKFNDKTQFGFSFGSLKERGDNFLGSKAQGAFAGGSNPQTQYASFNITRDLINNWQLTTSYSEGKTSVAGNNVGVLRDFNNIKSRGGAVGLLNDNFLGGKLAIAYSEPLRVYSGTTNIDIPISRDFDGNVQRLTVNGVSLKPDGKERDLEFSYSFNLKNNAEINFNSIVQKEAGNIKDAKDQYIWMVRYNFKY